MKDLLLEKINNYQAEAIAIRRKLHESPELSSQEFKTSQYLKDFARQMDLEIIEVPATDKSAGTGFIAILDTGRPGKTLGLRADIDALPIVENPKNLAQTKVSCSKIEGVMHACGHDGHMATALISMKILKDLENQLSGRIIFIFEEGEEISSGIFPMIDLLKDYDIDVIYGNHCASFLPTGQVTLRPGPVMAASSIVNFNVVGKGGHGSRPDLSINPLFAGVDIINTISTTWNQQINVEEIVTLGLTEFHVGSAVNVIADRAQIGGTLRYFNQEVGEAAYEMIIESAKAVAQVHRCQIEVAENSGPEMIPVVNDDHYTQLAQEALKELYPESVDTETTWFASESFGMYRQLAPIVFAFVGMQNEDLGSGAEHHNEYFDYDDDSLAYGIGSMVAFASQVLAH